MTSVARTVAPHFGSAGRVFPQVGGLVAREGDRFVVIGGDGLRATVEGALCDEVAASLEAGSPTHALARLAPAHPALGAIVSWLATPAVPLTALDLVRLDGFDTFFLELLGRCNERCVHCYADASPTVGEGLARDTALRVIAEAATLGFRRIQLTGGDPLLCDYLPEAARAARDAGFEYVEIYTNGLALNDELLDALAPAAPAFAVSIYSADPDEHDRVTQTPGSHRRTLAAIDRALARGHHVRAGIIVVAPAVDVPRLHALLVARGVPEISATATYAVGRGTETAAETVTPPAVPGGPIGGGGHRATGVRGEGKLCVTYAGDVVPCIFQRSTPLGNVRDGSLSELLARGPRRVLALADDPARRLQCRSCRLTEAGLALLRGVR